MREILVDWLVDVMDDFNYNSETLLQAVNITDIYLSRVKDVPKKKLQLVGAVAMMLSAKINEMYLASIDNYVYLCDEQYEQQEFILLELDMIRELNGIFFFYRSSLEYLPVDIPPMMLYLVEKACSILEMVKYDSIEIAKAVKEIYDAYPKGFVYRESSQILLLYAINQDKNGKYVAIKRRHAKENRGKVSLLSYDQIKMQKICTKDNSYQEIIKKPKTSPRITRNDEKSYVGKAFISEGSYCSVYGGEHIINGDPIVIKKSIDHDRYKGGFLPNILREVSAFCYLEHPNIVRCLHIYDVKNGIVHILERMDGDLSGFIKEKEDISADKIISIMYQILQGLSYCHSKNVIHRDIKPGNVLYRDNLIKLCDFNLATLKKKSIIDMDTDVASIWYRPPEILLGKKNYSYEIDIWGAGCILAQLATGRPLFPGDSRLDQLFRIFKLRGTPDDCPVYKQYPEWKSTFPIWTEKPFEFEKLGTDGNDLLTKMLALVPENRISATDALNHPYFK